MKMSYTKPAILSLSLIFLLLIVSGTAKAKYWHRGGSTVYYSIDRSCTDGFEITLADSRENPGPIPVGIYGISLHDDMDVIDTSVDLPPQNIEIPGGGTFYHSGTFSLPWDLTLVPGTRVSLSPSISDGDIVNWHTVIRDCQLNDGVRLPERFLYIYDVNDNWDVPPDVNNGGSPSCRPGIDVNRTTMEITEDIIINDLNVAMNLWHDTNTAELEAILTSPQGTAVTLIPRGIDRFEFGQSCDWITNDLVTHDMADFVLDDDSVFSLDDMSRSWQTNSSAWRIPGPDSLSAFSGENAAGTWTLDVCDTKPKNQGYLWCWDLEILVERLLSFSKSSYEVSEGAGSVTVDVLLSAASTEMTEVTYTTVPAPGSNQEVTSGKVQFTPRTGSSAGEWTKQITIPIKDDELEEADEVMLVKLSDPTNEFATREPHEAQIVIKDDDAADAATLSITVTGSGTISKSPDKAVYTIGEEVMLTAVADPGWKFEGWGGDLSGLQNPAQIIMNTNRSITAEFVQSPIDDGVFAFLPSIMQP